MDKKTNSYPMPMRLLLSGIVATFLIISTVLGGIYLGNQTQDRFHDIERSWQVYSDEAELRGELLNRMWSHLGYGGIIHNFKNYVLRQDQKYLDRLEEQFADFSQTIKEYRQSNPTRQELDNLAIIENTMLTYMDKVQIAKQAAQENWPPKKTDELVKVNDENALYALATLDKLWREKREETTTIISNAVAEGENLVVVGFRFMAALVVVSLVLFALFYLLQMELRQAIGLLSKELSERKLAQQVAKKFQRAVEQSPATIIITDTNKKIEYVNQKFCDLTGYKSDEVIGKTPSILQSGETSEQAYAALHQQLERGQEWRGEFHNKKKDGNLYWAKTSILPLREEDGIITHFIGLGEDITQTREARDQMHRAQKMEAVGMLASGVAHDFNNVLTIILGNVFLAKADAPIDSDLYYELEQIEIAAKRARNMVGQILTFARQQPGETIALRVGDTIDEVIRLMRASILPNVKIKCVIKDKTLSVLADPTRLHQVIMNLCSNAAEAIGASDGKITITAKVESGIKAPKQVCICVSDNGPGIPDNLKDKIFDPFFTTKQLGKGTGLGLSVVTSLITQMKGDISLETSSKGSEFKILLPMAEPSKDKNKNPKTITIGSGRILLIDDQKEVVDICKKILSKMNYQVDAFTNPKEAMVLFKENPDDYQLVMTDYIMPELSGAEVCSLVRELRPSCPIIIYSAYQPDQIELDKFKPIKLLKKPIDPHSLTETLTNLLNV